MGPYRSMLNAAGIIHQIEAEGYSSLRDIAEQLNRRGV